MNYTGKQKRALGEFKSMKHLRRT